MPDEKIESKPPVTTTPPVTTDPPAPPAPPTEPDEPAEPSLIENVPKITIKEKDDDGNELSDEEKTAQYSKAAANAALDNSVKIRVDNTVNNYLSAHPEYAPFADRIRKFVNHENRFGLIKNGLPVETVIVEAIGVKNIMRIGAEIAGNAQKKADETKNGGSAGGDLPPKTTTDLRGMNFKDFSKVRDAINNSFIKK